MLDLRIRIAWRRCDFMVSMLTWKITLEGREGFGWLRGGHRKWFNTRSRIMEFLGIKVCERMERFEVIFFELSGGIADLSSLNCLVKHNV